MHHFEDRGSKCLKPVAPLTFDFSGIKVWEQEIQRPRVDLLCDLGHVASPLNLTAFAIQERWQHLSSLPPRETELVLCQVVRCITSPSPQENPINIGTVIIPILL